MTFDPNELAATAERPKTTRKKASNNGKPNTADVEANQEAASSAQPDAPAAEEQAGNGDAIASETTPAPRSVLIEFPIHSCISGYASKNIDFDASPRQAAAAKVLFLSLSEDGARCFGAGGAHPDGKTVESISMGIRWFLDRLADQIEAETGKSLTGDFGLSF